jgi:hypothetical protein
VLVQPLALASTSAYNSITTAGVWNVSIGAALVSLRSLVRDLGGFRNGHLPLGFRDEQVVVDFGGVKAVPASTGTDLSSAVRWSTDFTIIEERQKVSERSTDLGKADGKF